MSRLVLDFELCVDAGNFTPVCCHQPNYGFHEREIMNEHITAFDDSRLITDCEDSRGSLLLFTTKPHQEDCSDINAFYLEAMR